MSLEFGFAQPAGQMTHRARAGYRRSIFAQPRDEASQCVLVPFGSYCLDGKLLLHLIETIDVDDRRVAVARLRLFGPAREAAGTAGALVPGDNLAAVVARRSAELGGPEVLLQVLICPVTDSDTGSLSYTDPGNQLLLDRDEMIWFWDQYVPDPSARIHPDASPLQAVFLTGVPPTVILTAEHDVLRDEGELYAMRLVQAGVPVQHRRFAGQMHGFLGRLGVLPGSAHGLNYIAEQVSLALADTEQVASLRET